MTQLLCRRLAEIKGKQSLCRALQRRREVHKLRRKGIDSTAAISWQPWFSPPVCRCSVSLVVVVCTQCNSGINNSAAAAGCSGPSSSPGADNTRTPWTEPKKSGCREGWHKNFKGAKCRKGAVSGMKRKAQIELLERKGFIISPVPLLKLQSAFRRT